MKSAYSHLDHEVEDVADAGPPAEALAAPLVGAGPGAAVLVQVLQQGLHVSRSVGRNYFSLVDDTPGL